MIEQKALKTKYNSLNMACLTRVRECKKTFTKKHMNSFLVILFYQMYFDCYTDALGNTMFAAETKDHYTADFQDFT